jgi:hypothetical protein
LNSAHLGESERVQCESTQEHSIWPIIREFSLSIRLRFQPRSQAESAGPANFLQAAGATPVVPALAAPHNDGESAAGKGLLFGE